MLPKVLHCAETITGGIASYLRELIPLQLAAFGEGNVIVVIPASQVSELPLPAGVILHQYDDSGQRVVRSLRLGIDVWKLVRALKPTVVHVHSTFAGATVRPILALTGRKVAVVYCAHGWAWDRMSSSIGQNVTRFLERFLSRMCARVICISDFEYRTALDAGLPAEKLCVVKNAVSLHTPIAEGVPPEWQPGKRRVLFVGRVDRQKGLDVLLDALALLGDRAHLIVAGAAVLGDSENGKAAHNVTYLGWQNPPQLTTLFESADVLVVPSRWEGFGLVAAEAMRAGLPVIASRVGGLPEVVEHGVTGLVVTPESAVALCEAVRQMDDATLAAMRNAGRKRVTRLFSMDRLHRELSVVYASTQRR